MPRRYHVISADSHLDLAPDHWTNRVPAKWRDRAPRRVRLDSGLGVSTRQSVGVDNVMWGSDFAHAASEWPHSRESIEKGFAGVPEEERYFMLAGNAVKFFHLDNSVGLEKQSGEGVARAAE